METGDLIVYTSADPVMQIAAHLKTYSTWLYRICEYAREITKDDPYDWRIIARPYVGELGNFQRTSQTVMTIAVQIETTLIFEERWIWDCTVRLTISSTGKELLNSFVQKTIWI